MTKTTSLPVAILVLMFAPPASGLQTSDLSVLQTSGCYRLELGPWSRSSADQNQTPPTTFQLDTAHLQEPPDRLGLRKVLPLKLDASGHEMRSRWRFVGSDSVYVVWSN